jgi:DNA-binding transcriptional LysR family regulator
MLELRRLRLLREVAGRGTVHAAARALGYSPSAISQQLAVLEREAGTPLLERSGRTLRLTAAGQSLVSHAATLLAGMEQAQADLDAIAAGRVAGVVRVAAFQSAFLRIVAPAIRALADAYPDVRIEADEAEFEQAAPALGLHQFDVVVGDEYEGRPRPIYPDLTREVLLREAIKCVLRDDHPAATASTVSLKALTGEAWAACQPGTGQREMHMAVCRGLGGFEPDVRYSSDDLLILLELVRTVGAATLLPELVLGNAGPGVVAKPIADGYAGRMVFLLTRKSRSPAVTAVADALRDVAGREIPASDRSP